jgi:transposase
MDLTVRVMADPVPLYSKSPYKRVSFHKTDGSSGKKSAARKRVLTINRSKATLIVFEKQLKEIEKQIKEIVDQDPDISDRVKKVEKIKGLRLISIVSIIAETDGFALVTNAKQLTSYAGLDVVLNESGLMKHKTRISKKGNKHLRTALYMPALSCQV